MKTIHLYVSGTHCNACKILIEDIIDEQDRITHTKVDLSQETVQFETDLTEDPETLAQLLTEKMRNNGYTFSATKQSKTYQTSKDIWLAIPIGLGFLMVFFLLQRSGLLNFGIGGTTTPVTSFLIGLVASVSSCLAVVGGLVLSLSATVSQNSDHQKRLVFLFHVGRLLGFGLLGGILGAVGNTIGVNFTIGTILGAITSLVMILLGIHLMGFLEKTSISLPSSIYKTFRTIQHQSLSPFLLGFGTFFLPCGFTQSMQLVALSSGSFVSGALIMLTFALGTLPVLALLSFGPVSFADSKHAQLFFQSVGVIVTGLGIFGLLSGLAGLGIINPIFVI